MGKVVINVTTNKINLLSFPAYSNGLDVNYAYSNGLDVNKSLGGNSSRETGYDSGG